MLRAAASLGIAALGGGVSLVGAGLTGHLGSHTTIEQVVTPPDVPVTASSRRGLTVEQIYKRDAPGVVQVTAAERALGSGFVIDKTGHIVTSDQVIAGARHVQVSFSGRHELPARVVGGDPSTDVAVLQIDARPRSLTPLPLGDSDAVEVGDQVVAIGNADSLTRMASAGIVSAVDPAIDRPAIRTDAAIVVGDAGGPLIDADGEVIGLTAGAGVAVPVNTVKTVAAALIRNGKIRRASLGLAVAPLTPTLARLFDLPASHGLLVQSVTAGSASARAGIRAGERTVLVGGESYVLGGDIVVAVDGTPVASVAQLRELLTGHQPGDRLTLALYRGQERIKVGVTLGRLPR